MRIARSYAKSARRAALNLPLSSPSLARNELLNLSDRRPKVALQIRHLGLQIRDGALQIVKPVISV